MFQQEEQLDGEALIRSIHAATAENSRIHTSFANTLEANISTVFNSGYKFIYELLQNADDAGASCIQFNLTESELIISHNGTPFSAEDVNKLCDNAMTDSDKSRQLDKTGYKGVGFKAVFCISKNVTVVSEPYCFRFDEAHWTQSARAKYPWPIIPIWTDITTVTSKVPSAPNLKVHFILSDINAAQIQAELNFVFQSTEVLLLLRHICEIKIHSRDDRDVVLQKTIPNTDSITSLIRSEAEKRSEQSWLMHAVNIVVPAPVHDAVQSLSAAECPEKIKQATVISLTFAALIQDDQLMGMEKARIYCYLPTQVCAGLPYLVNADFILNQDRSLLMNNIWNRFLLNAIAYEQFIWLGRLANNPHWATSILNLLALPRLAGLDKNLKSSYTKGYQRGVSDIAFIPSTTAGRLLKFREAIIDKTEFFKYFGHAVQFMNVGDAHGQTNVVHHDLLAQDKLIALSAYELKIQCYDYDRLISQIGAYLRCFPEFSNAVAVKILKYFQYAKHMQSQHLELLREQTILYCQDGILRAPKSCYVAQGNSQLVQQFDLKVLHPSLMQDPDLRDWLQNQLKVSGLNKLEVIRNTIVALTKSGGITRENSQPILIFICEAIQEGTVLSDHIYQDLQKFPVVLKNGQLLPVSMVYMMDGQSDVVAALILDDGYVPSHRGMKDLLIRMGIKSKIGLTVHATCSAVGTDQYYGYYQALRAKFAEHLHRLSPDNGALIYNFITYDFLDSLEQDGHYALFWRALRADWQHLSKACYYDKQLVTKNLPFEIPHFLVHYMNSVPCIRVRGRAERMLASQIYAPDLFSDAELPLMVADIPGGLNREQARFLGFKTQITLKDCLALLASPAFHQCQPKKIKAIYKHLLACEPQQHNMLLEFPGLQLLAADGTLQPVRNLVYFDMSLSTPRAPFWLHLVDLSAEEGMRLAEFFSLATAHALQRTHLNVSVDNSLSKKIEDALRRCLPILAKLEERITHISATAITQTMLKKFQEIKIKRFDGVVVAGTHLNLDVYHDNSVLYVHKNRRWVQFTRREIAAVLGVCLQLSESTIEQFKTLINTATQEELDDALQIFGIDVPEYQTLDQLWVAQMNVLASQMAQINLQDQDVTGAERDQAPTESVAGQQTIQAAPLIHTPISLVKTGARGSSGGAHSDSRAALHGQKRGTLFANTAAPEDQEILLSRGKLGEQKFYDYLLAAAQKMGWQIEETALGFTAQNAESCLCVEWPNKQEESFQSIDFKITYHSQVYMFEVKSSKYEAAKKKFLNLSTNEWENLVTYKNRYALVCVFAVESANPKVSIIWNPLKKIIQNSMKPDSMILRWGYNSFEQLLGIPNEATMAEFTEEEPVDYRSCMMQIS